MNKIYYIAYYDVEKNKNEKRNIPLAAKTKLDYIFQIIDDYAIDTEIISPCCTLSKSTCLGKKERISEHLTLKRFFSFGRKNQIIGKISILITRILFYLYAICTVLRTDKTDKVIVYHSLHYYKLMVFLKKIKNFKLIVEAEEIYGDVCNNQKVKQKELGFFKCADAYIFPTQLLNEVINIEHKPFVIIHGTYRVEYDRRKRAFDPEHIHCVYAGTLDPRKGGCAAAVAVTEFLPDNYHMHIIGFGNSVEINNIKALITKVSKNTKAIITYDGMKSGEEYIEFIQSCDIGLSTQNPDASFNATSFPSKILSYLANGLRVVSVRIPVVESSAVGEMLYYYDKQEPQLIAAAIKQIDIFEEYDSRMIIDLLSETFRKDLLNLLQ